MFQLIVAVISIALVAALAIASLYYGGQAFQKSSLKANVTTLVNAGQQVAGADALYKTDNSGVGVTSIASLVPEYLAALPAVSSAAADTADWAISVHDNGTATPTNDDFRVVSIAVKASNVAEICAEVAKQAGEAYVADQATFAGQFGCSGTGAATVFNFKI